VLFVKTYVLERQVESGFSFIWMPGFGWNIIMAVFFCIVAAT
jgi:hypothetical protein